MEKLTNIIESLLYVSGKEISIDDITDKLQVSKNEVNLAVLELKEKYSGECGIHILHFNDKIQFGSNPEYGEAVETVLNPIRERELSRSMLEVAAIIAYKQPVTRAELEHLRGGNSDYAISNLMKLGIIDIVGRKDAIGHPYLYGTTDKFLKRFQISSLEELPDYDSLIEQVKELNSEEDNYLYRKDVYVEQEGDDEMPPQRQFVPKEKVQEEAVIADVKDEEVPDFLKGESVELYEAGDESSDEEEEEAEDVADDDTDEGDDEFEEYSIDDEDVEYEDEEEDTSDYSDDEESDEDYDEDDK